VGTMKVEAKEQCPFCAGSFVVGYSDMSAGEAKKVGLTGAFRSGAKNVPTVSHSLPMCTQFATLDVVEYLRAVNSERAAGDKVRS